MCVGVKRISVDCTTDHNAQVRNQKNRHSFLASLSMLVEDYQLDGIDYNWEYPGYRLNIKNIAKGTVDPRIEFIPK